MKICVIGCGAVGCLFAAHLAKAAEVEVWAYVVCPDIVGPNLYLGRFCQVRREETTDGATADYANLHTALTPATWHTCFVGPARNETYQRKQPMTQLVAESLRP